MRVRQGLSILLFAATAAACSGNTPSATEPGGGGGGGGGSTSAPQATEGTQPTEPGGGGGGGTVDTSHGKATFQVSGPIEASGEYGFIPAASLFGGAGGTTSLSFSDNLDENASLFSILISDDGAVLISYAGPAGSVPAAECTTTDWNIGATSASGKFDCTAAFSMTPAGATVAGGRITGEFTASAT